MAIESAVSCKGFSTFGANISLDMLKTARTFLCALQCIVNT